MKLNKEYLRSAVFGFEDSLVSTTGVVIGISAGAASRDFILLAGIVTVAVEALSMGAGEYLTERTVQEVDTKEKKYNPIAGSIIMFCSYFLGGLIPLFPVIVSSHPASIAASFVFATTGLFILGYIKGKIVKISPTRSAFEMLIVGGIAAGIGALAGFLLRTN